MENRTHKCYTLLVGKNSFTTIFTYGLCFAPFASPPSHILTSFAVVRDDKALMVIRERWING